MNSLWRIFNFALWGILTVVLGLLAAFVGLNWRDEAPSYLYRTEYSTPRPLPPDEKNIYYFLMGFNAPAGQNPVIEGKRRADGYLHYRRTHTASTANPLSELVPTPDAPPIPEELDALLNPPGGLMLAPAKIELWCEPAVDCLRQTPDAQALVGLKKQLAEHAELATRYRQMLQHKEFSYGDPVFQWGDAPLPQFGEIAAARKLLLNEQISLLKNGQYTAMLAFIQQDQAFWRNILRNHGNLISDMLASTYIRQNSAWVSAMLSDPYFDVVQHAPQLQQILRPLSEREKNLSPTFQTEFQFGQFGIKEIKQAIENEASSTWDAMMYRLLYKPQASLNRYADEIARLQHIASAPATQFAALSKAFEAERTAIRQKGGYCLAEMYCLYNPIGNLLSRTGSPYITQHVARVFDLDAYLHLVDLQFRLRQQAVTFEEVPQFVASQRDRYNPYTDQPFIWNSTTQQLSFQPYGKWPRIREEHPWQITLATQKTLP